MNKRLAAEALGAAFLLATVIGSGVMGTNLAGGNVALALLGNTIPTGAILVVLILIFGPISGAHFNPAVSLAFACGTSCRGATPAFMSPRRSPARSRRVGSASDVRPAVWQISDKVRRSRANGLRSSSRLSDCC